MSYQVLARKWRPQTFSEVVFQDHISTTIRNSIRRGRIAHAYLFAGPRGVGKTTMARILAKSLNCQDGPTDTPCGTCKNCIEIRDGNSFDVMEIDGASNRGIENIRELRESVAFAPVEGRYKIYIIDEVHMLTKEAFNALLKTLEEPPPHVVFIFATTEIHQVPETILSRCQKFYFKRMTVDAIANHLATIAQKEGYAIEDSAIYAIARAAEGSMRDAQSLLDQVISFSDGVKINEESALGLLGIVSLESHVALLRHIAHKRSFEAIMELDRAISLGADMPRYIAQFSDLLRAIRLFKHGIDIKPIVGFSEREMHMISELASLFNDEELSVLFKITTDLLRDLRFAPNERICIEMAILDMIAACARPSLAAIIQKLEGNTVQTAEAEEEKKSDHKTISFDKTNTVTSTTSFASEDENQVKGGDEKKVFNRTWTKVLAAIKKDKPSLFAVLSSFKPTLEGTTIMMEMQNVSDAQMLDEIEVAYVQEKVSEVFGKEISLIIKNNNAQYAMNDMPSALDQQNIEMPDFSVESSMPNNEDDPLVEKIIDLFHAKVVQSSNKGEM